ncbi:hypothetical protein [Nocardioides sp. NPDC047086]|uniref:hypothetical protein n=1 Tax=Nocardioides sp. NPDC047086 TaxID=3154810 RepID=UPI0033C60503
MSQPATGVIAPGTLWRTEDPDEATNILSTVYAPHSLTAKGGGPFSFSLQTAHSQELMVGFNRFGSEVRIDVPPPSRFTLSATAPTAR